MDRKSWKVDVDGKQHEVVLNWTYWGGARQVSLDGKVVNDSTVPMRWKSEQAIDVDGRRVVVRTKPFKRVSPYFVIELEVDGKAVAAEPGPTSQWEKAA